MKSLGSRSFSARGEINLRFALKGFIIFCVRLVFHSWLAWNESGLKGSPIGALAIQLGTTRQVVLNLLKAGRLDEIWIYEAGKHIATLVKF